MGGLPIAVRENDLLNCAASTTQLKIHLKQPPIILTLVIIKKL
jgi:hypothetical protein